MTKVYCIQGHPPFEPEAGCGPCSDEKLAKADEALATAIGYGNCCTHPEESLRSAVTEHHGVDVEVEWCDACGVTL